MHPESFTYTYTPGTLLHSKKNEGECNAFLGSNQKTGFNYFPFGMSMPGRSGSIEIYRFGAFGYECDPEVSGSGNSYTTEFRQYDPRLGRWKSLDPMAWKYPAQSPFAAFNNNPLFFKDPLGLEGEPGTKQNPYSADTDKKATLLNTDPNKIEAVDGEKAVYFKEEVGGMTKAVYDSESNSWALYSADDEGNVKGMKGRDGKVIAAAYEVFKADQPESNKPETPDDLTDGGIDETPDKNEGSEETGSGDGPGPGDDDGPPGDDPDPEDGGGGPPPCHPVRINCNFSFNPAYFEEHPTSDGLVKGLTPNENWNRGLTPMNNATYQDDLNRILMAWQPCNIFLTITINTPGLSSTSTTPAWSFNNGQTSQSLQIQRGLMIRNDLIRIGIPASAFAQPGGAWLFINWDGSTADSVPIQINGR